MTKDTTTGTRAKGRMVEFEVSPELAAQVAAHCRAKHISADLFWLRAVRADRKRHGQGRHTLGVPVSARA